MLRIAFLVGGLVLLVFLVFRLGPAAIVAAVAAMGWTLAGIGVLYAAYELLRALALRLCVVAGAHVPFAECVWIRLSGKAVEALTFTGPFLAEPAKAWLLERRGLSSRQAFAAVVAEYLVYTFVSAALSIAALSRLMTGVELAPPLHRAAQVLVAVMSTFLVVALIAIVARIYLIGAVVRGVSRVPGLRRWVKPDLAAVRDMEDLLLVVLRERPGLLVRILFVHGVAQGLLVLELGYLLATLHPEAPPLYAFLADAGTKFTSMAFFFVPTQLGAAEATYAVVFDALALPATTGVAVAFVRRLRSLAVAVAGLAAMSALLRSRRESPGRP